MNTDQIFEEIQNDYLCIQEEYQELDNLIYKYNNLNYAFEEVSVQLEAINKFGLSDETNYFINKDNYLVENNYIAEEDLYDKNKVIITLEGILSTIISGIDKIIKAIAKVVKNIFKFIFGIIKKIFGISDNTDKKAENIIKLMDEIEKEDKEEKKKKDKEKKDKEDKEKKDKDKEEKKEKAKKKLNDFIKHITDKNILVNNILYKKLNNNNVDSVSIINNVSEIVIQLSDDIIKLIELFNKYITNIDNCLLDSEYIKAVQCNISYADFTEETDDVFSKPYKLSIRYFNEKFFELEDIFYDCGKLSDNMFKINEYYNIKTNTITNNLNVLKPFKFTEFKLTDDFYKNFSDIVKFENTIDLSKNNLLFLNESAVSETAKSVSDFFKALRKENSNIKSEITKLNNVYKSASKNMQKVLWAFENLSKKIKKARKDDDISTEKYIKECKYYQSFISNLLLSIKSEDIFVLKELGFNVCLNLLYSCQRSFDNIVKGK